jgi:rare lipoprotein A
MNKLTAAHKTLPFGTVVRIKNIQNNKTVNVRINDRGPYRGNRIIDLSYGAAKELGLLGSGQALVGLNIVGEKSKTVASEDENFGFDERNVEPVVDENISMKNYNEESSDDETFALQAGAFYSMKNAENQKMKVEELTNRPAVIIRNGDLYKVRIEGIASRNTCDKFKKILETDNITTYVLQKKIR